ncbi:hypothetical protein BT69DRAFT_1264196 [Atractiella rhizophila]|nr:hypothetical protein BT69DRAFT_1264196 [Atractiella rhizophila]
MSFALPRPVLRALNPTSLYPVRFSSTNIRALLGRYDHVPVQLARVQSGKKVSLRDYETQRAAGRHSYDLKMQDGKVIPAEGDFFLRPNGCSLRPPSSPTFQEVVRNFRGRSIHVFLLEKGTPLPKTLTILHEHSDHYSLQCTEPMTLSQLNGEITKFMSQHARTLGRDQFMEEFPFEEFEN